MSWRQLRVGGVVVAGLLGRKADAFAGLLDGTSNGAAGRDPALAQLANLTQRLSSVPQPSAAFRSSLREQLVSAAGHPASAAAPTASGAVPALPRPRVSPTHAGGSGSAAESGTTSTSALACLAKSGPLWIKLSTGVAAVAVAATGVGVGADRALPGDLFYGVKMQVEAFQLDLASGARDKATTQLGFAQARLNELQELIRREEVRPDTPVSSATAGHIRGLLEAWAQDAGVATTSLIQQIRSLGGATSTAASSAQLRKTLQTFTHDQFAQLGSLLGAVSVGPLQTLTGSALGFLQRVDGALGGDPAALIKELPIPLNSIPGLSAVTPQLNLPSGTGSTGSMGATGSNGATGKNLPNPPPSGGLTPPSGSGPTAVPSLLLPTALPTLPLPASDPAGVTLPTPSLGILPTTRLGGVVGEPGGSTESGGPAGGAVDGVTGGVGKTVAGLASPSGAPGAASSAP